MNLEIPKVVINDKPQKSPFKLYKTSNTTNENAQGTQCFAFMFSNMASNLSSLKLKSVASYDNNSDDEKDVGNNLRFSLEGLNLGRRKKLLVLNLGGLLVHRVHKKNISSIPSDRYPDFIHENFLVFKRPFCEEFLKFCFERFEVGIWSSAMLKNINAILGSVMGGDVAKLLFVWGQQECRNTGFASLEKKGRPIFIKELKKLWNKKSLTDLVFDTLLIDDEPCKALLNPPNTAIFPHPFKVKNAEDTFLAPAGELQLYLKDLAGSEDVPLYVRNHPIGQPVISASHPDWQYYSKIVQQLSKGAASGKQI